MGIKLCPELATGKIVDTTASKEPMLIFSSKSDVFIEMKKRQEAETQKLMAAMAAAIAHQTKCDIDAKMFLNLYWGNNPKSHTLEIRKMREWLDQNQPLDRWFLVRLIEAAGEKALELGYSQYKAEIAKQKNIKPRLWVLSEWSGRADKEQSKAAFSRQYSALVKARFGLNVTSETISRDWLPKESITFK